MISESLVLHVFMYNIISAIISMAVLEIEGKQLTEIRATIQAFSIEIRI